MGDRSDKQTHFAYIDALRGYAIIGVLIVHTGQLASIRLIDGTAWGARGVQLFFVVSALTLAASWHSRCDGTPAFLVRRIFRIAPMFWLAIAWYAWNAARPAWDIAASLSLLHGVHPLTFPSVVPGGWSIGDEALFYLVFPLLAFTLTTWLRSAIVLGLAYAAAAWWWKHGYNLMLPLGFSRQVTSDFTFGWLLMQLPAFLSGFLAFHTLRAIGAGRGRWIAEAVLLAAVTALATQMIYVDFQYSPRISVLFGVAAAAMGLGAGRYLVNPVITHIGKVSYSAYLVHFAVLGSAAALVRRLGLSGWPAFATALMCVGIAAIAIATVTYLLVERPFIKLGREMSMRLTSRRIDVVASAAE